MEGSVPEKASSCSTDFTHLLSPPRTRVTAYKHRLVYPSKRCSLRKAEQCILAAPYIFAPVDLIASERSYLSKKGIQEQLVEKKRL